MKLNRMRCLFCLLVSVLHAHGVDQEAPQKKVFVNINKTSCVRLALPHMKGVYVKRGSLRLRITSGDDVRVFEI